MKRYWWMIVKVSSQVWQWTLWLFVYIAMFAFMMPMAFVNTVIYCFSKILFTLTSRDKEDYFQMCEHLGRNDYGYGTVYLCRNTLISFVKLTPKSKIKAIQCEPNQSKGVTIEEKLLIACGLLMSAGFFFLSIVALLFNPSYFNLNFLVYSVVSVNGVVAITITVKRLFKIDK